MTFLPRDPISITGANLTGSSPNPNRTYTLEDDSIDNGMSIIIEGTPLQIGTDFTFTAGTYLITFLNPVWDAQKITINYFTETAATALTGGLYTSTLEITRASGIGIERFSETLGTGDGSEDSFDASYGNIIDGSYVLYYGASGSNNITNLTENTHYTINKDRGTILLTTAGKTALSTNLLYIDYVYSPRQSNTVLASYLEKINAEVDKLTGNYWGTDVSNTEYFDGFDAAYPQGDEPYTKTGEDLKTEYELKYEGITSITSIKYLDNSGTPNTTLTTPQYRSFENGRTIINQTVPNGQGNVQIIYVHGYDDVPALVTELASIVGGMMALVNISGGSYKDVSTYTLGRKTFSIGQVYVNIRESIIQMKERIKEITESLGYRYECA